jgi:preprotein translocase subunit SecE
VNRETKRMLQRKGAVDADGTPVRATRTATPKAASERTPPGQYVAEVRSELKKVVWPTKPEIRNYTIVVLGMLTVMTALTFGLDYFFAKGVFFVFDR